MRRAMKKLTVFSLIAAMAFSITAVPSSAATGSPKIEDVEYNGSGVVEVDFVGDVKYKRAKVTVRDNKGKKYKAKIVKKDEDDLKFRIKKYKKGRTYTFKIKGVKKWYNGGKYRTVKGKVKIRKASKFISAAKAKQIALKRVGLKANQVTFLRAHRDYDDGYYIYEVDFRRGYMEYEFEINAMTGRIISWDADYDD